MVESADEDAQETGGHRGAENPNSVMEKIMEDEEVWNEILDGIENYDDLKDKAAEASGSEDFATNMFGPKDERDYLNAQTEWNGCEDKDKKKFVEWMETIPDIKTKFFDVHFQSSS